LLLHSQSWAGPLRHEYFTYLAVNLKTNALSIQKSQTNSFLSQLQLNYKNQLCGKLNLNSILILSPPTSQLENSLQGVTIISLPFCHIKKTNNASLKGLYTFTSISNVTDSLKPKMGLSLVRSRKVQLYFLNKSLVSPLGGLTLFCLLV